jgi:YVTN family beta-propeller protein
MIARRVLGGLSFLLLVTFLASAFGGSPETPTERPRFKSPLGLAIDPTGQFAYVALHTADALAVVDLQKNSVLCEIPVGKKPYDVALYQGIAYVTCEADDTLVAVDIAARKVKRTFNVGQSPRGVSVDPRTGLIHVVCHDDMVLWTQNVNGNSQKDPLPPQPEGNFARASNLELIFTNKAAYRQYPRPFNLFTRGQSIFDPKPARFNATLDPQRTAFNPLIDHDYTRTNMDLVAHTRPRWFLPTAGAPEGRIFTNAFSFFLNSSTSAAVVLLDEPTKGYPDPTDVVVKLPKQTLSQSSLAPQSTNGAAAPHPLMGAKVFISSGGADTVVVLDLDKAAKHFEANKHLGQFGGMTGNMQFGGGMSGVGGYAGMGGMQMHGMQMLGMHWQGMPAAPVLVGPPIKPGIGFPGMGFPGPGSGMVGGMMGMGGMGGMMSWQSFPGLREDLHASNNYTLARLPTQANPRRMVLTPDGKTLVVSNHLADSLTLIHADKLQVMRHIDLGGPKPDTARRGEILFHSAKHTFQQQFTCATCHPNNGADGLSWDTSPKGNGERLNTRALHGVRDTGPFGWRGESETFVARVKNTMAEVHKHKISDADASAIAAYLETLDPPRPLAQKAKDVPAIERGKTLFYGKANCKSCHRGDAFTSDSPRAVVLDHQQKLTPFDVPSLRGVSRTAPYLHDGRAATLREIFEKHNPQQRHGRAHELTPVELGDLVAFLKSL